MTPETRCAMLASEILTASVMEDSPGRIVRGFGNKEESVHGVAAKIKAALNGEVPEQVTLPGVDRYDKLPELLKRVVDAVVEGRQEYLGVMGKAPLTEQGVGLMRDILSKDGVLRILLGTNEPRQTQFIYDLLDNLQEPRIGLMRPREPQPRRTGR